MNNEYPILNTINNYDDFLKIDNKNLDKLASEIRNFIIQLSKEKSIHLSSNLGIIETTLALSKEFNLNKDFLFYDTGHQSYIHKIITGRKNLIYTIRDTDGLSGMQNMNESKYDYYSGGHSGNSLSICAGFLEAIKYEQNCLKLKWENVLNDLICFENNPKKVKKINRIKKQFKINEKYVVPVIGDSAIANGVALEALNDISFRNIKPIIVLNDKGMSISKAVGSIPLMISKIKTNKLLSFIEKFLYLVLWNTNFGKKIYKFIYKIFHGIGKRLSGSNLFTSLGYQYIGPINGHNIKEILIAAKKAKWYQKFQPVILHIKTEKGKGLDNYTKDKIGVNHSSSVNESTAKLTGLYLSEHLSAWVASDKKINIINPAMTYNSGFLNFTKSNSDNYFDVGISEEHAISMASGMAIRGLKPIVVIYSSFLQRSYDQLLHDFSRLNLPLLLLIDRAEISGGDGDSHHGIFDIGFLKSFPNTIITAPSNIIEAKLLIDHAITNNKNKIFAIRYPKKLPYLNLDEAQINEIKNAIENLEWLVYKNNKKNKNVVITYGNWVNIFKNQIKELNLNVDIINAININNYDFRQIEKIFNSYKNICIFEETYKNLGLANDFLQYRQKSKNNLLIRNFTKFPGGGNNKDIYLRNNMDVKQVLQELIEIS
ncbi:1-deoxy-D-xylulose-5-phosphate synthase [Mycoplasmoides pirum]|uniref:1-deoxy-D-xylulose-5-phosphate synthase n=1 Tax=Mycoplasmoides pirum TaxID=2122 RepID=UPI0005615C2C|nr:1-deoxy-D-xylulose-5-phosphate synthase [Mycoplasmoides pirum]